MNDDFDVESLEERRGLYMKHKWTNEWYIQETEKYQYEWNHVLNQNWEEITEEKEVS